MLGSRVTVALFSQFFEFLRAEKLFELATVTRDFSAKNFEKLARLTTVILENFELKSFLRLLDSTFS